MQLQRETKIEHVDPEEYRSLVGSLLYLSHTHLDICYAVGCISRYMQAPQQIHFQAPKRILRYLRGTAEYGLHLTPDHNSTLHSYADADWGRDLDTRRSISGILHQLGNATIGWSSKMQPTVSLSSTEAEYKVLTDAAKDIIHLRRLIQELGFDGTNPTSLMSDNQSCIKLVHNPILHARMKHIDIQHHFIREASSAKEIQVGYIPTKYQPANFLTKPLALLPFTENRRCVGIVSKFEIYTLPTQASASCSTTMPFQ